MPVYTEAEGIAIMADAIAAGIGGSYGGVIKAAAIADVITALQSGPKTQAAIAQIVAQVIEDGGWIAP